MAHADAEALVELALDDWRQGDHAAAFEAVDRAVRISAAPPVPLLLFRGKCLESIGFPDDALANYVLALRKAPESVATLKLLLQLDTHYACLPAKTRKTFHARLADAVQKESSEAAHMRDAVPPSPATRAVELPRRQRKESVVDIIIPVYRDFDLTRLCINSVLASHPSTAYELVVVDDDSPEPNLSQWLDQLAGHGLITLIRNKQNLGFIRTVNRALNCHPQRDVVLLNADTAVGGDWLDRLRAAAYRQKNIASATPFSNNGEHFSFPVPFRVAPMPTGTDLARLQKAIARANDGRTEEVPFGIGFCLYLRRDCLDQIGYLEEDDLVRGYGEEADWCLRSREAGWKHVCAADVYVAHKGNVSFGDEKTQLVSHNNRLLRIRHPRYESEYDHFTLQDPLLESRQRLEKFLLEDNEDVHTLIVGSASHEPLLRLAGRLAQAGKSILLLQPDPDRHGNHRLRGFRANSPHNLTYRLPDDESALRTDIRALRVQRIFFVNPDEQPPEIRDLPRNLGLPYEIVVNDFGLYCPRKRLYADGRYCGDPEDFDTCQRCVGNEDRDGGEAGSLRKYRNDMREFVRSSPRVVAGSADAVRRLQRRFPDSEIVLDPGRAVQFSASRVPRRRDLSPARFLVPGPLFAHTGYQRLLSLGRICAARRSQVEFIVLGDSCNDAALHATGKIRVTGQRSATESLPALAQQYRGAAMLHLPDCPVTDDREFAQSCSTGLPVLYWPCSDDVVVPNGIETVPASSNPAQAARWIEERLR